MADHFQFDQTDYQKRVSKTSEHIVSNDDALLTIVPRIDFESNSYHGAAIKRADQDRLSKAYPRLHR